MKYVKVIHRGEAGCVVEAEGFEGKGCSNATKVFTEALGMVRSHTVKKPEYDRDNRLKVGGGR